MSALHSPLIRDGRLFSPSARARRSADAGNQTQGLKAKVSHRTPGVRGGERCRKRFDDAQAGTDVRHSQAAGERRRPDHRRRRRRNPAGRFRFPALGRRQLSPGSRRHLRFAVTDPPPRPAHRRHGRRRDSQPEGGRALLRPAKSAKRSTSRIRRRRGTKSISTISRRSIRTNASSSRSRIRPARTCRRGSSTSFRRSARASAR